jgi:hypothetical protein
LPRSTKRSHGSKAISATGACRGGHEPLSTQRRRHRPGVFGCEAIDPDPFASARWGSLASFGAKRYPGTKRYYGTSGNSFVAAVEFGPRVTARASASAGKATTRPPPFCRSGRRYATGDLRPCISGPTTSPRIRLPPGS